MNQDSRTSNVIKNIIGGVGGQIFTSLLMFVCRTYFIKLLGATYLGVNGLFSNILSMLSLAELGIGPAIVFSMYKPIAQNDEVHVAKLMNFYKMAYRMVALTVLTIGLVLTPFIDVFIKDSSGIEHIRLIFALILLNTVVSYLFSYKGSMLNADQKAYVTVIIRNIFAVVSNIAQIVGLILTGNYYVYLITSIAATFVGNLFLSIYVDKKYPFLVKYKNEHIDKEERKGIIKRVTGMMMHKFGGFVLNSTDNLIISKFVGVISVGIYSNYLLIINLIKTYITQISGGISASVGNLIASENEEKSYSVFKTSLFIYFWMYSLCFIAFWVIFQPFICIWIGEEYLLSSITLFVVLINFFLNGMQDCVNTFTNATGLFWETRFKPIAECIINLGVSVVLAMRIGITGVFIGTVASYLATFWINPIVIYKEHFHKNVLFYFIRFGIYILLAVATAFGISELCDAIRIESQWVDLIMRFAICVILPNVLYFIIFCRTKEFRYCFEQVKRILNKR